MDEKMHVQEEDLLQRSTNKPKEASVTQDPIPKVPKMTQEEEEEEQPKDHVPKLTPIILENSLTFTLLANKEERIWVHVLVSEFSGGIALFWNINEFIINPMVLTEQEIHASLKVSVDHPSYHRPEKAYGNIYGAFGDNQNMSPKKTNERRTRNQPAPQPVQADPLDEHVSHVEFRDAFTTLANSFRQKFLAPIPPSVRALVPKYKNDGQYGAPCSKSQGSGKCVRTNLLCGEYGKNHKRVCRTDSDICFGCGKLGHRVRNCPQLGSQGQYNHSSAQSSRPNQQSATSSTTSGQHPKRLYAFQSRKDQKSSPNAVTVPVHSVYESHFLNTETPNSAKFRFRHIYPQFRSLDKVQDVDILFLRTQIKSSLSTIQNPNSKKPRAISRNPPRTFKNSSSQRQIEEEKEESTRLEQSIGEDGSTRLEKSIEEEGSTRLEKSTEEKDEETGGADAFSTNADASNDKSKSNENAEGENRGFEDEQRMKHWHDTPILEEETSHTVESSLASPSPDTSLVKPIKYLDYSLETLIERYPSLMGSVNVKYGLGKPFLSLESF
ncbi:hypothetical protein FXO38_15514 [Capsicum annuum]|nr:hypothetical protein FXO38_15514 [Capsicum annuum]